MSIQITETNAQTGETIQRELSKAEETEFLANVPERDQELVARAEAAAAKKAAILAALADATGYSADELKEALNA